PLGRDPAGRLVRPGPPRLAAPVLHHAHRGRTPSRRRLRVPAVQGCPSGLPHRRPGGPGLARTAAGQPPRGHRRCVRDHAGGRPVPELVPARWPGCFRRLLDRTVSGTRRLLGRCARLGVARRLLRRPPPPGPRRHGVHGAPGPRGAFAVAARGGQSGGGHPPRWATAVTRGEAVMRRRKPSAALRRPRAALLWGVALFAGLQLALAGVMEKWRPEWRDPEYGCKLARLQARQAEAPGRPLVVVLGSSRAALGFRPDAVAAEAVGERPVVFNFAIAGAGPLTELLQLRRLLAAGVRPDWLVIEVMPPLLHQEWPWVEENLIHVERLAWADLRLLRRHWSRAGAQTLAWAA